MKGREFIRIAREMDLMARAEKGIKKEVWLRRAVSTLYYGVLHEVISFLEQDGARIDRNYRIHTTARILLTDKVPKAGTWLRKLHKLRTFADYDIDKSFTHSDYRTALQLTKLILKEVGR